MYGMGLQKMLMHANIKRYLHPMLLKSRPSQGNGSLFPHFLTTTSIAMLIILLCLLLKLTSSVVREVWIFDQCGPRTAPKNESDVNPGRAFNYISIVETLTVSSSGPAASHQSMILCNFTSCHQYYFLRHFCCSG